MKLPEAKQIQRPMAFRVPSADLLSALAKVSSAISLSADKERTQLLLNDEKNVYLVAYSSDAMAACVIPNAVADKKKLGGVSFDATILSGLLKNRGVIDLGFDGKTIFFKAVKTAYEGKLPASALPTAVRSAGEQHMLKASVLRKGASVALTEELKTALSVGLSTTALQDVFSLSMDMAALVEVTKDSAEVTCFDGHHMAQFKCKVKNAPELKSSWAASHFGLVSRFVGAEEAKFYFDSSGSLCVQGKDCLAVIPALQAEEARFKKIKTLLAAPKKPVASMKLDVAALAACLSNMETLHTTNSHLSLSALKSSGKDGELVLTFSTVAGSAKDAIKVKELQTEGFKAAVSTKLLSDLLAKASTKSSDSFVLEVSERLISVKAELKVGGLKKPEFLGFCALEAPQEDTAAEKKKGSKSK